MALLDNVLSGKRSYISLIFVNIHLDVASTLAEMYTFVKYL